MELVNIMIRIDIACLQEIKWVAKISEDIEKIGYILWFYGKEKHRNWIEIVVDRTLKENVVDTKTLGDRYEQNLF